MRANRRRDTTPERAVRSAVHRLGLRYRVDALPMAGLRRRADLVFAGARVAVFVDGCFWHGCPLHGTRPSTNRAYWDAKLEGNRRRDAETNAVLAAAGWLPLRFWEHDDPNGVAVEIATAVSARTPPRAGRRGRAAAGRACH
jgi:DNA mismatch endonuclease (patch repair protein)